MGLLFVTVGSTKFDDLIETVCSEGFQNRALTHGYDSWVVQFGSSTCRCIGNIDRSKIELLAFDYNDNIDDYFAIADLIISHGGTGSILDGIRGPAFLEKRDSIPKVVVVPNHSLLHDHQSQICEKLHEQGVVDMKTLNRLHEIFNREDSEYRKLHLCNDSVFKNLFTEFLS